MINNPVAIALTLVSLTAAIISFYIAWSSHKRTRRLYEEAVVRAKQGRKNWEERTTGELKGVVSKYSRLENEITKLKFQVISMDDENERLSGELGTCKQRMAELKNYFDAAGLHDENIESWFGEGNIAL
jgi:chromosome segregation ATPase